MVKKGSKKSKNKKKRESEELKEEISEVDKEYYQILINDLQGQVTKLTERCQELESRAEEIQNDFIRLDEDRADIIAFLRRQLEEKSSEIAELQERLTGLKQCRASESAEYEARITALQHGARVAEEQLSSEIKLLQGKLNSLEEFRAQRDDLNAKFARQEQETRDREAAHQSSLHDVERKFILSKDRLKKEMEQQLLRLSTEYQAATTTRMAATTQRAVRENAALQAEVSRLRNEVLQLRAANVEQEHRAASLRREVVLQRKLARHSSAPSRPHNKIEELIVERNDVETQTVETTLTKQRTVSLYEQEVTESTFGTEDRMGSSPDEEQSVGSNTHAPSYAPGSLGFVATKRDI